MTPAQRLKEIEDAFKNWLEPDTEFPASNIEWLINRVKRLTEALEEAEYLLNVVHECPDDFIKHHQKAEHWLVKAREWLLKYGDELKNN